MANTIQIKRSSTAAAVPTAGQLAVGELAVNLVDKRLFTKDGNNAVVELTKDSYTKAEVDALLVSATPSGTVLYVARNTAPTGYLKANGAAVSRTTYAALFAAIGTTFGAGDGSTTFLLPDLRGEFIRGWADGRAVDTGRAFGTFQDQAFASHAHNASVIANYSTGGTPYRFAGYAADNGNYGTASTSNAGGTETRPRNVALLACIKF